MACDFSVISYYDMPYMDENGIKGKKKGNYYSSFPKSDTLNPKSQP